MRVIHKYGLFVGKNIIEMPKGAQVLKVADQRGALYLWAVHNTNETNRQKRYFGVLGTGAPFELTGAEYLDTVLQGIFVWHVFEIAASDDV